MKSLSVTASLVVLTIIVPCTRADEKSHRQAAEELLQTMGVEKQMDSAITQSLAVQIKQNPALTPYKEVMRKFLSKHLSYAALKDDLIQIYVDEFTEPELQQITAFYKTPAGKKLADKGPALMGKGMKLGMERVAKNQEELKKMIQDEANKPKDKQ
ncbi:MAG TPA: DUF2059 domain-containing protein [Gemmataceae bacterium]|nr:DUF2059 domain-containing protein [Gemmataceae bacterium]